MNIGMKTIMALSIALPAAAWAQSDARAADARAVKAVLSSYKQAIEKLAAAGTARLFTTNAQIFETAASEGSYTTYLFEKGVDKIAKKTGEEAVELVIAAKNGSREEIVGQCADLFYHTLGLLANAGMEFSEVCTELKKRH